MQEVQGLRLDPPGRGDPPEEETTTHSSVPAWEAPR